MDNPDSPPLLIDYQTAVSRLRNHDAEMKVVVAELRRRREEVISELRSATDVLDVGKLVGAISELHDLANDFEG